MLHCVDNDTEKGRTCSVQAYEAHAVCTLSGFFFIHGFSGNPRVCGVGYAQSVIARAGAATPAHDAPHLSPSDSNWPLMLLGVCGAGERLESCQGNSGLYR